MNNHDRKKLSVKLQKLMQEAGITSFKQLYQLTGTSAHTIDQMRSGKIATLRWEILTKISRGLKTSELKLLKIFGDLEIDSDRQKLITLQQEYQHLQHQFQQQQATLKSEFQHQSLQILESFLTYFPTAKYAATNNPELPASKLFPLVQSVDKLIAHWDVTVIGAVGTKIAYDPQWHQLIEGNAHPDELVTVRYVGYRQQDKLIFRAKVSRGNS